MLIVWFFFLIFSFFYPAFSYILRIASWLMTPQSKMKLWLFWPSLFWTKLHHPLLARWQLRGTLWFSHHRQWSKFYVFIPCIAGKNNALTVPLKNEDLYILTGKMSMICCDEEKQECMCNTHFAKLKQKVYVSIGKHMEDTQCQEDSKWKKDVTVKFFNLF